MKRPEFIARQSGNPSGLLGRLIGWIMAKETAGANNEAIRILDVQPTDHVLEVGFGHGRTIERIASLAREGVVAGIDRSGEMLRMAQRNNERAVSEGRVQLHCGDSAQLPYRDSEFDKVLSVHTLYFWSTPEEHLRELYRVMKPKGVLVLGFRPAGDAMAKDFPPSVYRFYSEDGVCELLGKAGFVQTTFKGPSAEGTSFAIAAR